jgi:hypothetical protein
MFFMGNIFILLDRFLLYGFCLEVICCKGMVEFILIFRLIFLFYFSIILRALRCFAHTISDRFSNPFQYQVWYFRFTIVLPIIKCYFVSGIRGQGVQTTCLSPMWVQILTGTLDSLMWGSYPASLWIVNGSTQVPIPAWNNERKVTWGLSPLEKLRLDW